MPADASRMGKDDRHHDHGGYINGEGVAGVQGQVRFKGGRQHHESQIRDKEQAKHDGKHRVGNSAFPGQGKNTASMPDGKVNAPRQRKRSEEHTSELQSLMRISYAVFCLKKKKQMNRTK